MLSTGIYQLALNAYTAAVRIAAASGNEKARQWVLGRREAKAFLSKTVLSPNTPRAWVHCASLGEYELALPVIDSLRNSRFQIVISFFSPSGFLVVKNKATDYAACLMLPMDSPTNARIWFDAIKPSLMILSKSDTWYYYLKEAASRHVPAFLISARFTRKHFDGPVAKWNRHVLGLLKGIGVQDEQSLNILNQNGITHARYTGDVRFDRVIDNARATFHHPLLSQFAEGQKVLVAGSTWPQDEQVLKQGWQVLQKHGWRLIIAPHELEESHLQKIETEFYAQRLSAATIENLGDTRALLIDSIGILKYLYRYGKIAYVGGAFKQGLHNILEAAAYGIPVIYGPKISRFPEASALMEAGGGYCIGSEEDLTAIFKQMENDEMQRMKTGAAAFNFIKNGSGAAQRTLAMIFNEEPKPHSGQ